MPIKRYKQIEKDIEDDFVDYALTLGVRAIKFKNPGETGYPDRICLCPGAHTFFIEFKKPNEVPRKKQTLIHKSLRDLDYHVYVADNLEFAKQILQRELNERNIDLNSNNV